ncbi:hypothetical protein [Pseudaquabacterium pictum]|uniref:DUF697 domain-containing protein n=1 Tax=Pseudaquabacterium pictum TaxID=2315236 RepID=A0A480AIN0_9BURK|nr:hypothetical protein [Rubrivivax pictus]GCL61471.1 hypothetical protein AQPW35_05520 [Rubrivivax pictus]
MSATERLRGAFARVRQPAAPANPLPETGDALAKVAQRCRQRVRQRALMAAGVAMVPVPGIDWVTDVGVLVQLLPEISAAFGLSPQQVERLAPDRRIVVYKAISAGGSVVLGKLVTRELVLMLLKTVGVRLSAQQAAKYLPIAGQVASAALTYSALHYVCEQHIRQCEAVARQLLLPAPPPAAG